MGWKDQLGVLRANARADVVCFDADIVPRLVFVAGALIYDNH
jgi:imidazolonepropionase-like amidohydrolase